MKKLGSISLALLLGGILPSTACDMSDAESTNLDNLAAADGPLEDTGPYELYVEDPIRIPGSASNRTVDTTLCAPASSDGSTIADGVFPLVITSPGSTQSRTKYRSYCEHLASWGFVVVSQSIIGNSGFFPPANHKKPAADVSAMIDWLLSDESGLADWIDPERIGVAGHSMGGKVSMLAAAADSRIGAVVGWDPVDANGPFTGQNSPDYSSATPEQMPDIRAAIAVLGETLNKRGSFFSPACAPEADNFQQYFEHALTPSLEVEIFDADHMDWTDSGGCWPCSPCGDADRSFVQAITRRVNVAWFRRHLQGDTDMDEILALRDEVAAGQLSVQGK